jgi:hypothetical protein
MDRGRDVSMREYEHSACLRVDSPGIYLTRLLSWHEKGSAASFEIFVTI